MAITRVQVATNTSSGATSITGTFGSALGSHPLLVAIVATRGNPTITAPTEFGWRVYASTTSANLSLSIFYWVDPPSNQLAYQFNLSTSQKATIHLIEYSGANIYDSPYSQTQDGSTTAAGTGTTTGASSSSNTTDVNDVMITGHTCVNSQTYSAPTNSFSIVGATLESGGGAASTHNSTVFCERIAIITDAFYSQATIGTSREWISCHIALKPDNRVGVTRLTKHFKYEGDGNSGDTFSGMGFYPDILIILRTSNGIKYFRTPSMDISSGIIDGSNLGTGSGQTYLNSTNSDGFKTGVGTALNTLGINHYGIAFQREASSTKINWGSIQGEGATATIACGFAPDIVFLKQDQVSAETYLTTASHTAGHATNLGTGEDSTTVGVASLTGTGFTTRILSADWDYFWIAFDTDTSTDAENAINQGTYTGDGTSSRNITVDTGFAPEIVIIAREGITNPASIWTDLMTTTQQFNGAEQTAGVTGTHADGFTIGIDLNVNTVKYYYVCFGSTAITLVDSTPVGVPKLALIGVGK